MPLDWSNERYVRLYTRDTADSAAWSWQARALWPWMIARADGAGMVETSKGAAGVAAVVRLPIEVVEVGLAELLADGCVVATEHGYAIRNYVDAQTARATDTSRKARQRERERAVAASSQSVNPVTRGHTRSRNGHVRSRSVTTLPADVTPSRADPIRSEPRGRDYGGTGGDSAESPKTKRRPRARPVPMPADFAPGQTHRDYAATHGLDLDREHERFVLHHTAKGSTFASWPAALGTWLRNAVDFRSRNGGRREATGLAATAEILAERGYSDPFKPRTP